MSDGFVTVAQCVEGLPTGSFAWELLFCGFLAWFLLGAINEFTPMAFSFLSLEEPLGSEETMRMSAALALGNFLAILVGGWIADAYGRNSVIRPALLLTVACGTAMQAGHTFRQLLVCRFALGLASGGLLSTVPSLLAELLPSRKRGFYLTIWCAGWPAGALFAVCLSGSMPGLHWRFFYTILLVPAAVLYVCSKADMLPESPRYLYMVGRRDEGYEVLSDMYEKEDLPLPWTGETISVTCGSHPTSCSAEGVESSCGDGSSGSGSSLKGICGGRSSDCEPSFPSTGLGSIGVAIWLALTMFCVSSAAQSMKLWMPTMLVAQHADLAAATSEGKLATDLGPLHAINSGLGTHLPGQFPAALAPDPVTSQFLGYEDRSNQTSWHFADGPESAGLLQQVSAPLMLHNGPNREVVLILVQAYFLQIVGVVACAYASTWVTRRRMVQCALPSAALFTLAVLGAASGGAAFLCGPLMGLLLVAQAAGFNFLQVFATEYFPTSRRAKVVALVMFSGQVGNFTIPVLSGFIIHRVSPTGVVVFFSALYVLAWLLSLRLPLPSSREHPLHDVDKQDSRHRKRDWTNYQAI